LAAPRGFGDGTRHYRRVRAFVPPKRARPVWLLPLAGAVVVVTFVAAFAVGSLVIGSFGTTLPQTSAGGIPNAPPGVSFVSAEAQVVGNSSLPATGGCNASNLGTHGSPTTLPNGTPTALCLSSSVDGFAAADLMYAWVISWNASAVASTIFEVQISIAVSPSNHNLLATSYVETSAAAVNGTAVYALDLTQSSDSAVQSYSFLVSQL
jgi:hypothetical protein